MRYGKLLIFILVSVFLIGTFATTQAFAAGWRQALAEYEERLAIVEAQVGDLSTRVGIAETKIDIQEGRLDALDLDQEEQNTRLTALESQPPATGGIKVFDSSNPPQFVGFLVGIFPAGYKPGSGYEVGASFTVYIPEVGKFIELSRGGEVIESRFRFEYVYYTSSGCDDNSGTYAIPESDEVVDPAFISAHGFVDTSIGYIWSFYKLGDQQNVGLDSRHTGVIGACDDSPSGNFDALPLTQVELPFTLPLLMPLSFQ